MGTKKWTISDPIEENQKISALLADSYHRCERLEKILRDKKVVGRKELQIIKINTRKLLVYFVAKEVEMLGDTEKVNINEK